jgi:hypothetical protein
MLERPLAAGLLALALGACRPSSPAVNAEAPATVTAAAAQAPTATATPTSAPTPSTPTATPTPTAVTATPTSAPTTAAPTAAPTAVPATAPSAAALVLTATAVEPTGPAPLARDGETVVDPAASFAVELATAVQDGRLVLLDAQDAHLAATHSREVGATTRFSLAPASPLVPGSRYLLRLEGATGREMRDASGGVLAPLSFAVLAAGTPPPPEPKKRTRRRR